MRKNHQRNAKMIASNLSSRVKSLNGIIFKVTAPEQIVNNHQNILFYQDLQCIHTTSIDLFEQCTLIDEFLPAGNLESKK